MRIITLQQIDHCWTHANQEAWFTNIYAYFETSSSSKHINKHSDAAQSCKRASNILKPEPGPSPTFILKPDLGPKAKFTEWVKICAIVGYQKTKCAGIAAGTQFDHTQNSNHLDQNIGLNYHKSRLFFSDTVECNVSKKKETTTKLSTMAL